MQPIDGASRRRCPCGCQQRATHNGMANGVALMHGCELRVRRWVKYGPFGNNTLGTFVETESTLRLWRNPEKEP